jgi:hypothetical protein
MIRLRFSQYLKPTAELTDTVAQRECGEMKAKFDSLLANGQVFRGGYDSGFGAPPDTVLHFGGWVPSHQKMHIDPWQLTSAANDNQPINMPPADDPRRDIVNTLLHEAAHALGKSHAGEHTGLAPGSTYTEPYFRWLNEGAANSCVRY